MQKINMRNVKIPRRRQDREISAHDEESKWKTIESRDPNTRRNIMKIENLKMKLRKNKKRR